jgi:hypothetical protein
MSKNSRFRRKNQGLLKNSAKLEQGSQSIDGLILIQPEKADDLCTKRPGADLAKRLSSMTMFATVPLTMTPALNSRKQKNVDYNANRTK